MISTILEKIDDLLKKANFETFMLNNFFNKKSKFCFDLLVKKDDSVQRLNKMKKDLDIIQQVFWWLYTLYVKDILDGKTLLPKFINSYVSFVRERANITDQSALAQTMSILANNVTPLALGSVNRQNSHIRLVARKLLTSRKEKLEEAKITSIIETLTQKIYSHGHAIGRKEAEEIGLPIETPDEKLEDTLWKLYLECENFLELNDPIDPLVTLSGKEKAHLEGVPIAIVESENNLHMFSVQVDFKRRRQVPPNPQININLGLNLPPNISPQQIPQQAQQILQQMINQLTQQAQRLIQQEIIRQSPEAGVDIRIYGGKWQESKEEVKK